ncbi:hypothetical protein SJ05684_c30180 [Sinorhizobium sojae CCBAU 05684]|uniref:Uncharacterized protein n=2 Tax=Sinorhizobium sojae TaxID=716925 RepID=A0A249PFB2_9HYPH|nr:hypothetical protein SJ05684_c30180 [Sinorhizobium sojae CCBAU 05684]
MVTLEEKDAEIERLTQAVALARSTAREELFPEMSSRIKAEREQARRAALLEALTEAEMIGNRYLDSEPDRGHGALDVAHALIAKLEADQC